MDNINVLIKNLSQKKHYCQMTFNEFEKNPAFILENFSKDYVEEDNLLNLLRNSINNKKIRYFIPDILFLIDESSISDKVFEFCLEYPGHFRKTLLIQLAHLWLKKEYIEQLNQVLETPEAFYKLFLMYLLDIDLPVGDLQNLMLENKKYLSDIENYKEHIIGQSISQDKIELADSIIHKFKRPIREKVYRYV
jgi:hypothetical protein